MIYTYRFANLLSDSDLTELELSNVRFDRRIIVPGSFSASVTVSNQQVATEVKKIIPGRTIVHVYRGADIWGTYIIWQMRLKSGSAGTISVDISGSTLESWFYRRIFDMPIVEYDNIDQIQIFREFIENAQIGWGSYPDSANLGISVLAGSSGVLRDRTYKMSEAASVGQRIEELANVDNGFEYMIRTYVDSDTDTRVREMVWGYPEINAGIKTAQFYYPGNISSYELSYDATEASTAFWARGDSVETDLTADSEPLMTEEPYLADVYLSAGWPHLDKVVDYSSVTDIATLEGYAKWWRDNRAGIVVIPQIEINATTLASVFSPNELGSYATFTIDDVYFPLGVNGEPSYSGEFRIVGIEVSPGDRGSGETIRFVITSDFDPTESVALLSA